MGNKNIRNPLILKIIILTIIFLCVCVIFYNKTKNKKIYIIDTLQEDPGCSFIHTFNHMLYSHFKKKIISQF